MSTLKTNNVQVGQSVTATNNFTIYQPASPDGTVRIGVGNSGATTADVASMSSSGDFSFNSGYGSVATAYACRAWVNFNGTGTVAIRGSGNVSSITDNGTGDYTINFTTAMADANYSAVGMSRRSAGANPNSGYGAIVSISASTAPTTSALRVWTVDATNSSTASSVISTAVDHSYINVAIFH
jgi:hypothetical protein